MSVFSMIDLSIMDWLFVVSIAFLAGLVKGIVGFAMPMVLISGLSMVASPEVALAALIFPTLVTNIYQALRHGLEAAWQAMIKFRAFLLTGAAMLFASAQLVAILPDRLLYLAIALPVISFVFLRFIGWQPRLTKPSLWREAVIGGVAGFIGGLSGIWGPPTVAYLTAIDTPKTEHLRVQGVIYALGAVLLTVAHLQSGVLSSETAPLSALLVMPACIGMIAGLRLQARFNQQQFTRATLFVLLVAGLNLARRGLF